ncbi:MAG: Rid family detoxifying hydrolase [Anaerolineae bacterium]|nr:Rid family detoxifying hydrolase [Anaerolineae bacterium]MCA9887298.1 Rid family detoxifying hydrolase [Anaerolineae bacterium]MCA9892415.1 Rid family detoxifying hydrolase [Anaerolineae bacterium]MCB9460978.1 RidA family protein [Anaerolineaceae bacterium]
MRKVVKTTNAPLPVAPYSQGIIANGFVYTAGQVGTDMAAGKLAEGVEEQARHALNHVKAILEAAGSDMAHIVKTTVFLDNMDDFAKVNAVYATFFNDEPPARSAIEVARLPIGALVEIEVVALLKE